MNDSDNNNPNRAQVPPEDTNIDLKINRRSLGVYEQYLKKTTQDLARAQQSSGLADHSDESLSDDDKAFFDNFSDILHDNPPQANNTNGGSQVKPATDQTDALLFAEKPKRLNNIADSRPNHSSKGITLVASFCALLLVAVLVIVFNANNNLMALTDRLSSVNTQMSAVSDNISVIGKENSLANARAIEDEKAANAKNAASLASVNESLNTIAVNIKPIEYKPTAPAKTRLRSMKVGDVNTEPAISYDDFKNESQITVYREATN